MIRARTLVFSIAALAGLVLALGAFFAFQTYWMGEVSVAETPAKPAVYVPRAAAPRVAVLHSDTTAQLLGMGAQLEAHPQYWKALLQRSGWTAEIVPQAELEQQLPTYDLLVLPSAVCLSAKEKDAIRAFLEQGKGVIATWATGARDEQGAWLGWGFLQELTGADDFQVPDWSAPWYIAFSAKSPITAGMPAGTRAQVESPELLAAVALNVDAYWSNFRLLPADAKRASNFLGSVLHNRFRGAGRVVWLGFQENSAVGGGPDKGLLDAVLLNATRWAAGDAVVALEPWPAPYSSAVVPALNVGLSADNAKYAAETLLRSRARGSFFFPMDLLQQTASLVHSVERAGEIGCVGDPDATGARRDWRRWYGPWREKWKLRRLAGLDVSGISFSYGSVSDVVLPSLAAGRYRYFLVGAQGHAVTPQTVLVSNRWGPMRRQWPLQRLTRMSDDDLNLSPLGLTGMDQDWLASRIANDADLIAALGGVYILSYHTAGLSAPQYAGVLAQLLEKWQKQPMWVASGNDVADWWAKREQVSVTAVKAAGERMRIVVNYAGRDVVNGVALSVYSPKETSTITVSAVNGTTAKAEAVAQPEHERIQLRLPPLAQGSYSYELQF